MIMKHSEIRIIPYDKKVLILYLDESTCSNCITDSTPLKAFCIDPHSGQLNQIAIHLSEGVPISVSAEIKDQ